MTTAKELAERIAAAGNGKMRRHGKEWRVYCPVHEHDGGEHSPSLAIWDRPNGIPAMKCMAGCERKTIGIALRNLGIEMPKTPPLTPEQKMERAARIEEERVAKVSDARDILEDSVPAFWNSAVTCYMARRGIDHYDSEVCREVIDPLHPNSYAMCCPIVDLMTYRDPEPMCHGVSLLSLHADGKPRLMGDGHKLRSIHGVQKGFGVVSGDKNSTTLLVAEGVETMYAGMALLDIPLGVAVLSSSNMRPLRIPEWVHRVVVAADNDEPGQVAALNLQRSLAKIVPVSISTWGDTPGWDANDELMRRKGMK
jgi:hypothetical protein